MSSPSPSPTEFEDLGNIDFDDTLETKEKETEKETQKEIESVAAPTHFIVDKNKTPMPTTSVPATSVPATSVPSFELLYWSNPKATGVAFGLGMFMFYLLLWRSYSILSLVAFIVSVNLLVQGMFILLLKLAPLRSYIEKYSVPNVLDLFDTVVKSPLFLGFLNLLKSCSIIIRKSISNSLKCTSIADFCKMMTITYLVYLVGCWFSPLTLSFLSFVSAFTLPKLYTLFQAQIDEKVADVIAKIAKKYNEMIESNEKVKTFINFLNNKNSVEKKMD